MRGYQRDEGLGQLEVGSVVKIVGVWQRERTLKSNWAPASPGHLPGEVVSSPSWVALGKAWAIRGLSVNEVMSLACF